MTGERTFSFFAVRVTVIRTLTVDVYIWYRFYSNRDNVVRDVVISCCCCYCCMRRGHCNVTAALWSVERRVAGWLKMTNMKMTNQLMAYETAEHKSAGHKIARQKYYINRNRIKT